MMEELDRAIERIMGVGIEAMGGDNLAVLLCSHFDDPDDGSDMDDNGWSETATNAYEEIKREIEGLFTPVRAELAAKDAEIARLRGVIDADLRALADKDATIHQLGENAAKAAGEYAERVAVLEAELARRDANENRNCINWGPCSRHDRSMSEADYDPDEATGCADDFLRGSAEDRPRSPHGADR